MENNNRISFTGRLISDPKIKFNEKVNKNILSLFVSYYDKELKTKAKCNVSIFFDTNKDFLLNQFNGEFKNYSVAIIDAKRGQAQTSIDHNGQNQIIQQFTAFEALIGQKINFGQNNFINNMRNNISDEELPF